MTNSRAILESKCKRNTAKGFLPDSFDSACTKWRYIVLWTWKRIKCEDKKRKLENIRYKKKRGILTDFPLPQQTSDYPCPQALCGAVGLQLGKERWSSTPLTDPPLYSLWMKSYTCVPLPMLCFSSISMFFWHEVLSDSVRPFCIGKIAYCTIEKHLTKKELIGISRTCQRV